MRAEFLQVYVIFLLGVVGIIASLGLARKIEKVIGLILSGLIIFSSFFIFFALSEQVGPVVQRVEDVVVPPPPSRPARVETVVIEPPQETPSDPSLAFEELCRETLLALKELGVNLYSSVEDERGGTISEEELDRRSRMARQEVATIVARWRDQSSPYPLFEKTKKSIHEVAQALEESIRWCGLYATAVYEEDMEEYVENYRASDKVFRREVSEAEALLAQRK